MLHTLLDAPATRAHQLLLFFLIDEIASDRTLACELVYEIQARRARGMLRPDEALNLICWLTEHVVLREAVFPVEQPDPVLQDITARRDSIRRAYGLGDREDWKETDEPPEPRALSDEWEARVREMEGRFLEGLGEREAAVLARRDRAKLDRRAERGRQLLARRRGAPHGRGRVGY